MKAEAVVDEAGTKVAVTVVRYGGDTIQGNIAFLSPKRARKLAAKLRKLADKAEQEAAAL